MNKKMGSNNQIRSAFVELGKRILTRDEKLAATVHRSSVHNVWFTVEETERALQNIANEFLDETKLDQWANHYGPSKSSSQVVSIIMAGNIPLVGFHDFLAVLVSGKKVQVKLSDKDPYLMPWIVETLIEIDSAFSQKVEIVDRIKNFDVVIATGSNSSSRHFHEYFKGYPNIIRKNRNGIAVLTGDETEVDLKNLARDIFTYFGLGCRNVSKLYLPEGYNFEPFDHAISLYEDLCNHHKYRNNINYNSAVHILNKQPTIQFPHLILLEEKEIASRIGVLHYSYYQNEDGLNLELAEHHTKIQCVIRRERKSIEGLRTYLFGEAQRPGLFDYADGVDTMKFLTSL